MSDAREDFAALTRHEVERGDRARMKFECEYCGRVWGMWSTEFVLETMHLGSLFGSVNVTMECDGCGSSGIHVSVDGEMVF